ncbi:glycosyltransferase family protein [Singulisphaera acidiphila]|uniref:Bacterial membrane protein YfhO n=1 Tax=Singulisphaera acidiphila (strain ATCC BAA-1392 / DSM 18658 / VKM B-2454 / MOB10) TaxID=886293 RepID=L0DA94_SINAD|nr:YfhO family protein [Singulisphaera acidiphila]AGA25780.1 hypothetical protein Sinac_1397 [Singulisphaera acidiphila DSM 18658]
MSPRRELLAFSAVLAALVAGFFAESLFGGKVLSPADVLLVSASFRDSRGANYEPANRLLMDPVLQFQPWIEFNRTMIRQGRLPLWNSHAGCGAPHLANGQSAVFDPFQIVAYLGRLPDAYGWMAAARLWVAGLGMFLLARSWGFGPWGRWFAGLAFPFCGFLVVWLLYPVTNVAVWMPWLFWAGDRVLRRPTARGVGVLGIVTGLVLLGGHVQTSAHVLLAAGLYVLWQAAVTARRAEVVEGADLPSGASGEPKSSRRGVAWWAVGVSLGIMLAAVEVVPLGFYLTRSPVWEDRERERDSPWVVARPRVLGAICTAFPYAFGSQRRGQPHLGRALGVDNLNETAGGFAGLATLIWLAPLAWSTRRSNARVRFLAGLAVVGVLGACRLPPVDNLLRALPVLGVTDNRRLSLWVAFSLVLLGGIGLDRLQQGQRMPWAWLGSWVGVGLVCLIGSAALGRLEPSLKQRATDHYVKAAAATPGADLAVYRARAEHQVRSTLTFVPRYLGLAGVHLLVLAGLAEALRRRRGSGLLIRSAVLGLTLLDLFGFGFGLNPAIARSDDRPVSPVIAYLRRELLPTDRILAIGEEMPPNVLMRYGLDDARNYDSVEHARSLTYFAPLYEPGPKARTSRREITWSGVVRARDRLEDASVQAVVGLTPPPAGSFRRVDRVGDVWVARLESRPWVQADSSAARLALDRAPGRISGEYVSDKNCCIIMREIFDPGWRAAIDGQPVKIEEYREAFMKVLVPSGRHRLDVWYDPPEIRWAIAASVFALIAVVFALTVPQWFRSTRIMADGLGRTQAAELESDLCSSPANY